MNKSAIKKKKLFLKKRIDDKSLSNTNDNLIKNMG